MIEPLLWAILVLTVIAIVMAVIALTRSSRGSDDAGKQLRDELRAGREEALTAAKSLREEVASGSKAANETLATTLESMAKVQQGQLDGMTKQLKDLADSNQTALDKVRETVDQRVKELQEGNEKKLEEVRKTVDEKLHETLEKRLGESFKQVSDRLESVQKGLGEMQTLATGVGDLKRVLTNVKARGTWAEVQLGSILEQILAPGQFDKNVRVKPMSGEVVEYAVRLPGPKDDPKACVWLPIDSKFPQEDYLRLQDAADRADVDGVQRAIEALARRIRAEAKDIRDKYLDPPGTTDFGIMFLATEGLYAEVLRQPALVDELMNTYRVVVAGPTTLAAILSSLRMGFQTLAIEQQAAEVWRVLGAVKTEFGKFGGVLAKVKRQLNAATTTIDQTDVRVRKMEKSLHLVEKLPTAEAQRLIGLAVVDDAVDESDDSGEGADEEGKGGEDAAL